MRNLILFLVFLAFAKMAWTQDIHFSQFFFAPQTLNPAEIGAFAAQYRVNANQKTQWREVSQPYSTFALSVDGHFSFFPKAISLGLSLMNDRAGDSKLNTLSVLAGGSYLYEIDSRQSLRGGLQLGVSQIKVNYTGLSFDNQYNGVAYDPNLSNGENFARNSRWFANVNLGALYTFRQATRKTVSAGWALHNISRPDQSFYNDVGVKLPIRNSLYANVTWRVHDDFDLLPSVRWMQQATFSEVILGSAVRYVLFDERGLYRSAFIGYYGRFGDSGIAMAGFEIDEWRFAASYDINVSKLKAASRNQGGFEFSLQYLFNRDARSKPFVHKFCPVFI